MRLNRILLGIIAFLVWGTDASAGRYKHILKQYEAATTRTDFTSEMTLVGDYTQKDIKHFAQRYRSEYGEDPFVADFSYEILSHQRKWGGYRPDIVKVSFLKPKNEEQWIDYWASYYKREHQRYQASTFKNWFWSVVGVGAFVALVDHFWSRNKENIELAVQEKYSKYKNFISCPNSTKNSTDLYILSVGTDPKVLSDKDAYAMTEELRKGCGDSRLFGNIYSITLAEGKANREEILKSFNDIRQQTNEDDIFLFLFSGHGGVDNGEYVFATYEGKFITVDDIVNGLDADNCKTIFWFDTCHAGKVKDDFRNNVDDYIRRKVCPNVSVLMSSSDQEASYPDYSAGLGYFTKAIIDGLRGAADQHPYNRTISLRELEEYIMRTVSFRTNGRQHPQVLKQGKKSIETRLSTY